MHAYDRADRPPTDALLGEIADYVTAGPAGTAEAYDTARLCLMDSLGCMMMALDYSACERMLGPVVPGAELPGGARVPGTRFELEPVKSAFDIGCLVRWLDYNDTWLAAEWGHPSDNLGAILACADYLARRGDQASPLLVRDVLAAMIRAHEVQGVLALENAFNRVGLDHVILVRIASTAVAATMLGATRDQVINAVANAWMDGGALRTYRHAPNAGPRKSWAAGDATSRGVRLALLAAGGLLDDYPSALSAKTWGFYDVLFKGNRFAIGRPLGSYVMENVLFKVSYPAEFHAQTAVEAAVRLHPKVIGRLNEVERIVIETQEPSMRIINKSGPLNNYADRDHCLQYMTAIPLIHGTLTADHYSDESSRDPRIDALRQTMQVVENPRYSTDYLDPEKRSIGNAVQVFFNDGSSTERVEVEFPVGHRRRRQEALPLLRQKFETGVAGRFGADRAAALGRLFDDPAALDAMPIDAFIEKFVP